MGSHNNTPAGGRTARLSGSSDQNARRGCSPRFRGIRILLCFATGLGAIVVAGCSDKPQAAAFHPILNYQRTIQQALRDVSDVLIAIQKYREYQGQQVGPTAAVEDATRLARIRYRARATKYLEVLTNDISYYNAQLNLAVAREGEAPSIVHLYSSRGGGWQ